MKCSFALLLLCFFLVFFTVLDAFTISSLKLEPREHVEDITNKDLPVKRETNGPQPRTIFELFNSILDMFQSLTSSATTAEKSRIIRNTEYEWRPVV
uniref:Uncharacterized protein n=1 Tax=Phlebotomus papatasi TaxID=29031 RepID=A0A1B0DQ06_PHLPP